MEEDILNHRDLIVRNAVPSDHGRILAVMKDWWDGRDLTKLLLKIFFIHFQNTILIAEEQNELAGFLVGYFSQAQQKEAYIHLIGVHPDKRKAGLARLLYKKFFEICKDQNRTIIRACTSPINKNSVLYHQHVGFRIEPGNDEINGTPVNIDYLGKGDHMVLFVKELK